MTNQVSLAIRCNSAQRELQPQHGKRLRILFPCFCMLPAPIHFLQLLLCFLMVFLSQWRHLISAKPAVMDRSWNHLVIIPQKPLQTYHTLSTTLLFHYSQKPSFATYDPHQKHFHPSSFVYSPTQKPLYS